MRQSTFRLSNGIRCVHTHTPQASIAHSGFILNIGSRDEQNGEVGLAHFWEHMAFKGTQTRMAFDVINELECVGGELNAFTTKEKICFYSTQLSKHSDRAIHLLNDILFHSTFPKSEIEKEKGVIAEEINMYLDQPEEAIHDEMDEVLFGKHSLGNNILGTQQSIKAFTTKHFLNFVGRELDADKIIFSYVGPDEPAWIEELLNSTAHERSTKKDSIGRQPPQIQLGKERHREHHGVQTHVLLAGAAPARTDTRRIPFFMLINLMGGPSMNSRLNLELRENNGLAYQVDASYVPFTDTGYFTVYFGTEASKVEKGVSSTLRVMNELKQNTLSPKQLQQAKDQIMGQLAISEENRNNLMIAMGRSFLDHGRVVSLEELFTQIQGISAEELQALARQYFDQAHLNRLVYRPRR